MAQANGKNGVVIERCCCRSRVASNSLGITEHQFRGLKRGAVSFINSSALSISASSRPISSSFDLYFSLYTTIEELNRVWPGQTHPKVAYMALNDIDAAVESFKKALELEPNDAGIKKELAAAKKKISDRRDLERSIF
ncbi:unnamed protein product [Camellia sinensis]